MTGACSTPRAPRRRWRLPALLLLSALLGPPAAAQAPDAAVAYRAAIAPSGDAALDALAAAVSQTLALAERAPTTGFGLVARVRSDIPRLLDALRSEGFYAGEVAAEISRRPPDSPGLAEALEAAGGTAEVRFRLTPGPRYRIARFDVLAEPVSAAPALAAATARPFGVAVGDPARAGPVLDASDEILRRLRAAAHPLAALAGQRVIVDHDRREMEVELRIAPGPAAAYGPARIEGAGGVDADMLARIAGRRITGRPATPERLEAARRALLGLQLFDSVRAEPARALDPGGNLPVTFVLRERPRRAFGISAGWETVFGPTLSAHWEHRNLFGGAEALRIEAEGARVGASGGFADGTYRLAARLRTPEVLQRDIRMEARVQAARERLEAFDRNALILSALFDHRLNERTTLRAGPGLTIGEVGRDGDVAPVRRFDLTLAIRYDGTDSPLDPTRGWRLAATALPTLPLDGDGRFARLRLDGSTYLALDATAATLLALRAAAGTTFGETRDGLALDARFYAGGGGSVRGLPFQGLGARDSAGCPLGGASLLEGSVELRRRLTETLGVVGFVDAGAVGEGRWPDLSGLRVGAGLGIRYLTAIGPLRADVAVPLNRRPGDPAFGVYIGLGQAF